MTLPILTTVIAVEADVVSVRQRARRIAEGLGFEAQDQTRIATAVSEIARNAFGYAGGGKAEFLLDGHAPAQSFLVRISDKGGGIPDLDAILEGRYRSSTGMGLGIAGARRLVDGFRIETMPGAGTSVELRKALPRRVAVTREVLAELVAGLSRERAEDPIGALREQNQELMRALDELRSRQEELAHLNTELEDTNRGVVALYAELDEKAEQLRQASELKSKFLSNMSHEFRTPLNSILALSRLLLDRVDGDLGPEQDRQVGYIRSSAESLTEMVNDLLDIAKVEAGKVDVRPADFTVAELFRGLRGVLKPLQTSAAVDLVFEEPSSVPPLVTDEGKVAQILRNLVSNALKFTEEGEVRVSARHEEAGGRVVFEVCDTGVGISPADLARIFEEFSQVESPLQHRAKGTGLGLPLSRKLAELLGGVIEVESCPGHGSTFRVALPVRFGEDRNGPAQVPAAPRTRILVVDDEETFRYVLRQMIGAGDGRYDILEATDGVEGLRRAREEQPDVIVLDLQMPRLDGYGVLRELAADPSTSTIPVIVSTSSTLGPENRARLAGASAVLPKQSLSREVVATALHDAARQRVVIPGRLA